MTVTRKMKIQMTDASQRRSGARTRSESDIPQAMKSLTLQSVSPLSHLLRQPWNIPFPMMLLWTSLSNFTYVCMGIHVIAVNHCMDFWGCPKNVSCLLPDHWHELFKSELPHILFFLRKNESWGLSLLGIGLLSPGSSQHTLWYWQAKKKKKKSKGKKAAKKETKEKKENRLQKEKEKHEKDELREKEKKEKEQIGKAKKASLNQPTLPWCCAVKNPVYWINMMVCCIRGIILNLNPFCDMHVMIRNKILLIHPI